ncbi:MAG: VanW family protein [Clostridia bacterium]|nr:VanW family protein [Clostridia bacterium]
MSSIKKIILFSTLMVFVILVSVLSQIVLFSYQISGDKIMPGVYADGFYLGGMAKEEAAQKISDELSSYLLNNSAKIINGDTIIEIFAEDVADVDVDKITEQIYNANRENLPITYFDFLKMKFSPVNIETSVIINWQKIYNLIEMNQHLFYTAPVDAQLIDYSIEDDKLMLTISPSQIGYQINIRETATLLQHALANGESSIYAVMEVIEPVISTESLQKMANAPAEYAQFFPVIEDGKFYYSTIDLPRAAELAQPALVMPGQSISIKEFIHFDEYNSIVNSIKKIHISSVIYGCALQLGLEVTEHHTSTYINSDMAIYPYGQEAVLDSGKDLVITNNFDHPVIFALSYSDLNGTNQLVCKIYNSEPINYTYVKSVIEQHDLVYNVKVYRVYANDTGGVLSRTLLDEYDYPVPPKPKDN